MYSNYNYDKLMQFARSLADVSDVSDADLAKAQRLLDEANLNPPSGSAIPLETQIKLQRERNDKNVQLKEHATSVDRHGQIMLSAAKSILELNDSISKLGQAFDDTITIGDLKRLVEEYKS